MDEKVEKNPKNILDIIQFSILGISLLFVPVFMVPFLQTNRSIIDLKIALIQVLGGIALSILGLKIITSKNDIKRINIVNIGAVIFAASILISCVFSSKPFLAFKDSMMHLGFIILFFTAQFTIKNIREGSRLLYMSFAAGSIVFIFGIMQYFGYDILQSLMNYKYKEVLSGRNFFLSTIGNPEYVGSYLAILSSIIFPMVILSDKGKNKIINTAFFSIFMFGLIISGARGAFIGFFVSLITAIYISVKMKCWIPTKQFKIIFFISSLIIIFVLIIFSFPNALNVRNTYLIKRFEDLFDLRSESVMERIIFYCTSSKMISDNPILGGGGGSFKRQYFPSIEKMVNEDEKAGMLQFIKSSRNRSAEYAHCDYLQIWAEYGIFGIASFIWTLCCIFYSFKLYLMKNNEIMDKRNFIYNLSLIGGIICVMVNAMFSFPLQLPIRGSLFWIILGLAIVNLKDYIPTITLRGVSEN